MMAGDLQRGAQGAAGLKFRAAKCAQFPKSVAVAGPVVMIGQAWPLLHAWLQSEPAHSAESERFPLTSYFRRNLDRGPPTFSS